MQGCRTQKRQPCRIFFTSTLPHIMRRLLLLLCFAPVALAAKSTLFSHGKSQYVICLDADAPRAVHTAATELQAYLRQISGATLPIRMGGTVPRQAIYIMVRAREGQSDEAFSYQADGHSIRISGNSPRGAMYGVYAFLENLFGVRWYAPDCTVVPRRSKWQFDRFKHSEAPALKYRFVQYHHADNDKAWCAHNRINTLWSADSNKYGGMEAYWSAHTMTQFVSAKEFFNTHPEYFAERQGRRIPNGQLCLTNPEVLKICTERLLDIMKKKPEYFAYSLSQADNEEYCQCEKCTLLAQRYGAQSGVVLWFVNQVADIVARHYPDKYVGTFAYRYTRAVPQGIRPHKNVIIRLCSIECCFAHPLQAPCNSDFIRDLKAWGKIAPQLFIWDYVVNFQQYMAPFPNFGVLADNIRTYRDNAAIGVHEEGQYETDGGEFAELRAWVLARLLWNPEQDTDALVSEFIRAYYGKVARHIQQYFNLVQHLVRPDHHIGIYIRDDNAIYTEAFIGQGNVLLDKARAAVGDDAAMAHRVDRVRMQLMYLHAMRKPAKAAADGTADELFSLMRRHHYKAGEGREIEETISELRKKAE